MKIRVLFTVILLSFSFILNANTTTQNDNCFNNKVCQNCSTAYSSMPVIHSNNADDLAKIRQNF